MGSKFIIYEDLREAQNIETKNALLIGVWPEKEFESVKMYIANIRCYYAFKQDGHIALILRYETEVKFG